MTSIVAVRVPKWGLSMLEGRVLGWHKPVGSQIQEGDELVDVETEKINNVALAPSTGVLRRITVDGGTMLPVGALIGVIAEASVTEAQIDVFIAEFNAAFGVLSRDEGGALNTTEMVDTRLGQVRIRQSGGRNGVPVILIHGFASSIDTWIFTTEGLGDRPVTVLDLPGHGGSTKEVGDGSIQALAHAVEEVMTTLEVGTTDLVGHSLGAAVALQVAIDSPARVRKIALIAPAGLPGSEVSAPFLNGVINARRGRELRKSLEMLVADPSRITDAMVDEMIKAKRLDGAEIALRKISDQIISTRQFAALGDALKNFNPIIVAGEQDRIVGNLAALDLAPAEVHTIHAAGHMPHVEKPDEVNVLLKRTLA